eukprot:276953-Rhodomonas_salina.1
MTTGPAGGVAIPLPRFMASLCTLPVVLRLLVGQVSNSRVSVAGKRLVLKGENAVVPGLDRKTKCFLSSICTTTVTTGMRIMIPLGNSNPRNISKSLAKLTSPV